jgi:plasmid stabilization system protein ParE
VQIELHRLARKEMNQSFDWYQARSQSAAQRFRDAVRDAIEIVRKTPTRYARNSKFTRSAPVLKFPYRVIYSIEPECLFVVAIAHAKRRPRYWVKRLKDVDDA